MNFSILKTFKRANKYKLVLKYSHQGLLTLEDCSC